MATFDDYKHLLVQAEGGFQIFRNDNGNWTGGKENAGNLVGTNHGVSAPVYAEWIGRTPTESDMRSMTKTIALEIMKAWYWNKMSASYVNNQSVANLMVDHGVNAGTYASGKIVQEVLNDSFGFDLVVDGGVGDKTIAAMNSVNQKQLHEDIKEARLSHYESISSDWFQAWKNRLKIFVFSEKKSATAIIGFITFLGVGLYLINTSDN